MKQINNPYLPLYEYVPDGEPHIFENRVYIYGSHDSFGEFPFCHKDYVTYSCPLDDLTSWSYEGIIYPKKNADPLSKHGKNDYYAPDVCLGNDGKYYLYYSYSWSSIISVASSISPKGPFSFLGFVRYKDGKLYGKRKGDPFAFDPAIFVDDDKKIYLYSGFGATGFFPQIPLGHKPDGAFVMELEEDMLTIKENPIKIMNRYDAKTSLIEKDHAFFEASSMRKINGRYYFIYSSNSGHELCYAISNSPRGPFEYGGVIISNGDVGYLGRTRKEACYPLGNNHGSILDINGDYYIFYHRHTNYTNTDRQAMAERIQILDDGSIPQVEKTSMGLNPLTLEGKGEYKASICSTLIPKEGNVFYPFFRLPFFSLFKTYITQDKKGKQNVESQYIHNVQHGTTIGYKYFNLSETKKMILKVSGKFKGVIKLSLKEKEKPISTTDVKFDSKNQLIELELKSTNSKDAIFLYFEGKGKFDFYSFVLE